MHVINVPINTWKNFFTGKFFIIPPFLLFYDILSYMSSENYDIISYMEIKCRLKQLRKRANISQIKLQMETGIEQALISKYENNKRIPPTETLIILADYFNVSLDYLLGRNDK